MNEAWIKGSWVFKGNDKYFLYGMQPKNSSQTVGRHIQGSVKTNSKRYPYAGSHSHKKNGFVFFVRDKNWQKTSDNADNVLYSIHKSNGDHPSGVAVLGDSLFVVDDKDYLRWYSVKASRDKSDNR